MVGLMRIGLLTIFAASKKDPLGSVMERIHKAFLDAGVGEPLVRFDFGDTSRSGFVSSVDRVLKRHPELARFVTTASPMPGIPGVRRITNGPMTPAPNETLPFATLQTIAQGVPRSFPFHRFVVHFYAPEFGASEPASLLGVEATGAETMAGILLTDTWWVNGRQRSLAACTLVEADPANKKLPPPPDSVARILAACGKVKKTIQAPIPGHLPAGPVPGVRLPTGRMVPSVVPESALAVHEIVLAYRARFREIVERAALPHILPEPGDEAYRDGGLGVTSGPRKPALERAFKPMGYSCSGDSGTFTLRRRTPGNLSAELQLDVGTWGHSVMAMFRVLGVGIQGNSSVACFRERDWRRAIPDRKCRAMAEDSGQFGGAGRRTGPEFCARDRSEGGSVAGVVPARKLTSYATKQVTITPSPATSASIQ
jgi:hypothetical protein